jgi:hypothetical protein
VDDALPALGGAAAIVGAYEELMRWGHVRFSAWSASGVDRLRGALALRLDLRAAAARHFQAGLAWAERERCPVEAGRCLLGLGEAAAQAGRVAEARADLERAAQLFEDANAELYLKQARESPLG